MQGRIAYRQQFTRCGKQRCRKCKEGEGHGPYWYAYWSENGRTKSKYIGVRLPPELATAQQEEPTPEGEVAQSVLTPTLYIYLLGQFRVERRTGNTWQTIDSQVWQHRRARSLLGCLLSNPGHRLSREQAMKLLWPDLDRDIAANRLNGAVHELRRILEPDVEHVTDFQILRLERDTLELAGSPYLWVDAEAFEQLLRNADAASDAGEQERLLEEAASLYKGSYLLEELYSEWATPRRDALQQHWIDLLLKLASLRAARGSLLEAIAALDRLRTTDPMNETALQQLMVYLTRLHRRGEALRIYRQHADMLKRDYESTPLPETRTLYTTLRQGRIPEEYLISTEPAPSSMTMGNTEEDTDISEVFSSPASSDSKTAFARPIWQSFHKHQRPFVGRQQELEDMNRSLSAFTSSQEKQEHAHFTLLTGDPGIGKTRFLEELGLEAYTQGWLVAWSGVGEEGIRQFVAKGQRSHPQGATRPSPLASGSTAPVGIVEPGVGGGDGWPLAGGFRSPGGDGWPLAGGRPGDGDDFPSPTHLHGGEWSLAGGRPGRQSGGLRRGGDFPSPTRLLPYALWTPIIHCIAPDGVGRNGTTPVSKQEQLQFWEAMQALLFTACQTYPLLLLLEDLQWADEDSISFLSYLLHRLQQQPIFLVGSCRDAELANNPALSTLLADLQRKQMLVRLLLQPLPAMEIAKLIAYLPQESVQSISVLAAGNPFFAQELAQQAEQTSPQTRQALPASITTIFERYLSRVSGDCLLLIEQAARLGETFALNQLLSLADEQAQDEDTVLDLLEEALSARILREEGAGSRITYSFWHPLLVKYIRMRALP